MTGALYLIGCGIDPARQLTVEATAEIDKPDELVTVMPRTWAERIPHRRTAQITSLWDSHYTAVSLRSDAYGAVATWVTEHLEIGRSVGVLISGSPLWYDSIVTRLIDNVRALGCPLHITGGISSIEAVFVALKVPIAPALLITDTASVLDGRTRLSRTVPTLLMQPHVAFTAHVATALHTTDVALDSLRAALGETHAADHPLYVVTAAGEWADTTVLTSTVGEFGLKAPVELRGASIYLPAIEPIPADVPSHVYAEPLSTDQYRRA